MQDTLLKEKHFEEAIEKYLIEKGVQVEVGILEEECKRLNEVFIKNIPNTR